MQYLVSKVHNHPDTHRAQRRAPRAQSPATQHRLVPTAAAAPGSGATRALGHAYINMQHVYFALRHPATHGGRRRELRRTFGGGENVDGRCRRQARLPHRCWRGAWVDGHAALRRGRRRNIIPVRAWLRCSRGCKWIGAEHPKSLPGPSVRSDPVPAPRSDLGRGWHRRSPGILLLPISVIRETKCQLKLL